MRLLIITLLLFSLTPVCFPQGSSIQVGDGATTPTIREEFLAAYQRGDFFSTVALPPLSEVVSFGNGGFRQEFNDAARTGTRSALIRPAVPDLTLGVNNAVRQVRPPVYAVYTQSSIGVSNAGFPNMDTARFSVPVPGLAATFQSGFYQTFDRGFGIFVWDNAPVNGSPDTRFTLSGAIFSSWRLLNFELVGPPVVAVIPAISPFGGRADYQLFTGGGIYSITAGAASGKVFYLRQAVQDLYSQNGGPTGILGLPNGEELVLANGRRRQNFEGGSMEYAVNGTPVLKPALTSLSIAGEDPIRLTVGQTRVLTARLQISTGEQVSDRDVVWSTSNGRAVTVTGSGTQATARAVGGGTALITATSEGRTSNRITIFVASQCCAIGEGAPTQALTQTFQDAVQRNRLTVRTPVANPVRRVANGLAQEAIVLPSGERVVIAKADSSPLAFVLSGRLLSTFEASGGLSGPLGFPLSDASAGGTQRFENGALAGSPVRLVSGAILTRWLALGAETGVLGPPVTDMLPALSFTGQTVFSQSFRSGILYQFPTAARALLTAGVMAAKHQELGGAAGEIGAPLTDEFASAGLVRQEFEGAFLEYAPGGAVRVVSKERRPALTVSPASVLPGGRFRVSVGGFPADSSLRFTLGGSSATGFDARSANGAFVYESSAAPGARPGVVVIRAALATNPQVFAEGSYTVRSLAELRPALSRLSGDAQSGAPGTVLPVPLRVVLRDGSGNPIAGVPVRFEASPGGAIVDAAALTEADGTAQARLRLPAASGVALASVEAAGQLVTFSARSAEQILTDFPRMSQDVEGTVGSGTLRLADKGALVASLAAVIRFHQQRGSVPADNGLADTQLLNAYLRTFCTTGVAGAPLCDGYLDTGGDPQPNLFRAVDFAGGALGVGFVEPTLAGLREAFAANGPVIAALSLSRDGQPAGAHFVTVTGLTAEGDLVISDPQPRFGATRMNSYLNGFPLGSNLWRGTLAAAIQLSPRLNAPAFHAYSSSAFELASPAQPCSRVAAWPASFAHPGSAAPAGQFRVQFCDGSAPAYQAVVPEAPYLLTLTSLGTPASRTASSGAVPAAFRVARPSGENWVLSPEQIQVNAGAIVNAASFDGRLAPGTIVSIFGNGLPLAGQAGASVRFEGQTLPVLFSNGFQLNTVLPAGAGAGLGSLTLESAFGAAQLRLDLAERAPAIFVLDSRQSAAALNPDGSVNSVVNAANRGEVISVFGTGLGAVRAAGNGLSVVENPVVVSIGGVEQTPLFAGLAPGFIGLYQVNAQIPQNLVPGMAVGLQLRQGEAVSNLAVLTIR